MYIGNVLRWFLLMGGQTYKHRLTLSIDSELWRACSEISRQTGMNWSMVAAEAFGLYVRYFAPRDSVIVADADEPDDSVILQLKPLSESINYFLRRGVFRATTGLYSDSDSGVFLDDDVSLLAPTDIPILQLAADMPYVETPSYIFDSCQGDLEHTIDKFCSKFYRSCS